MVFRFHSHISNDFLGAISEFFSVMIPNLSYLLNNWILFHDISSINSSGVQIKGLSYP